MNKFKCPNCNYTSNKFLHKCPKCGYERLLGKEILLGKEKNKFKGGRNKSFVGNTRKGK